MLGTYTLVDPKTVDPDLDSHAVQVAMVLFERLVENVGEQLRPHFSGLQVLFSAALRDATSLMVRVAALKAVGQLVPHLKDEKEMQLVGDLIPAIIEVFKQCVSATVEGEDTMTAVSTAFEILDDLLECPVPIINDHMPQLCQVLMAITANTEFDLNLRERAANFFLFAGEHKHKVLLKAKLVEPIATGLLRILCESEADTPEDQTSAHEFAGQALNVFCVKMPNKHIFPLVAQFVSQAITQPDPLVRKAAMTILLIAAEGCYEPLSENLASVLPQVLNAARDPDQGVRETCCLCIGQFAEYLQPDILDYYETTLPAIFQLLDDPTTKVQEKSCYALYSFCESLEEKILPYMPDLMEKLFVILKNPNSKREVQEMAVAAISSVIAAAKEQIMPYSKDILELMQVLMSQGGDTELKLRARATECVGIVAVSIGRENFEPVAATFIQLAMAGFQMEYSELREYTYGFFANIAELFEDDFAAGELLHTCVGYALASLQAKDTVDNPLANAAGLDDDDESDDEGGARTVNVRTDLLDEKASACMALATFAKSTKAAFLPYVKDTLTVMGESTGYMHPDVRQNAQETCHGIMVCMHASYPPAAPWTPGMPPSVPLADDLINVNSSTIVMHMNAIAGDDDRDVVGKACDCLAETIDLLGPACIHMVLEDLCSDILTLLKGTARCQSMEEEEEDEEDVDDHQNLLDSVTDLVVAMAKAMGASFAEIFDQYFHPVLKYCRPQNDDYDRSMSLGCMAEMINAMDQAGSAKYVQKLLPVVTQGLTGLTSDVRRNAVFCLGVLCQKHPATMGPHFQQLLGAMQPLFAAEEDDATRDNGCGAVARMIVAAPASVPLPSVLPVWLGALPLKDDFDEADPIATALVILLEAGDATLAASLDHVAFVLLSCICIDEPNRPLPAATRQAAVNMIKKMPQGTQQGAYGKLSPDLQAVAQLALQ